MYGAIYGDLIGSLYEYREYLLHNKELMIEASKRDNLLSKESFISDDTILTMAIADANLHNGDYDAYLRRYILDNCDVLTKEDYFKYLFSPNMIKWAKGDRCGNSYGNGAIMRISPIASMGKSFIKVTYDTIAATTPSHNSESAIKAALCVSHMIFLASQGAEVSYIKEVVDNYFKYDYDFDLDKLRTNMKFNYSCDDTMPLVLYSLFNSDSFDSAMRLCLSLGGDTDTNCAIVGSIAEHMYGMDDELKIQVIDYLPNEYKLLLRKCSNNFTVNK